jgi:hypothetical protein
MSTPDFNRERLEELLLSSVCRSFPEADRAELNAILRHNAEARSIAARSLIFDASLADCLAASEALHQHEISSHHGDPKSVKVDFKASRWLAKAAAWVGAFHFLGNTAKAAGAASSASTNTVSISSSIVILMKKTITSTTAAILVLGSSGIYAIHHHNESSRARVASMETEIQSLSDELGIKTTRISGMRSGVGNATKTVPITQIISIFESNDGLSPEEVAIINQFKEQLIAMDGESLKNLLFDADKISNPIDGIIVTMIMDALIPKSPADATGIAAQLIGRGFEFQFHFSHKAAEAFAAWLAKDPAAADAWYVATAEDGGLRGKSIAPNGLEALAIDRSFARLRFAAQVAANSTEAAAMMATMLPEDVTSALQTITDPDVLGRILPALPPEQKSSMAVGVIKAMAVRDINGAFAWANSLGMADRDRDALMANGIEAAVAGGKLDLPGVAELNKNLILDDKRRSQMLVTAAKSVSLIPRKNEHVVEPDNSVYWDRVPERIDWLRKEAPADYSAGKMVGDYLGDLLLESYNIHKSIEAYENEVSRMGKLDPDLTIEFASKLYFLQKDGSENKARELLKTLPPSEKRDRALEKFGTN